MIQFDSAHKTPYGIHFVGNGGEEQLSILTSGGQGGTYATIIAHMQVDGGAKVVFQGNIRFEDFLTRMKEECERWLIGSSLNRPTEAQIKNLPEILQNIWKSRPTEEVARGMVQADLAKMMEEFEKAHSSLV